MAVLVCFLLLLSVSSEDKYSSGGGEGGPNTHAQHTGAHSRCSLRWWNGWMQGLEVSPKGNKKKSTSEAGLMKMNSPTLIPKPSGSPNIHL